MLQIGPAVPLYYIIFIWIVKSFILATICTILGWLGIRILDAFTPKIHERIRIAESPIAISLFIGGFFIYLGLIIHGTITKPIIVGVSLIQALIDFNRLALIVISFIVSLLFSIVLFQILRKLIPEIPFKRINEDPIAIGVYIFGYFVLFGLIIHAALTTSL